MDAEVFVEPAVGIALIGVTGDDAGRIVRANRALATLLARPLEELTGAVLCDFVHTDDRERALAEFTRIVGRARGSCEGEGRLLVKEGGVRWVRVHAGLMPHGGDARPMVMLHISQIAELTEQRAASSG
jgi:PAS domain S-box-containing protein